MNDKYIAISVTSNKEVYGDGILPIEDDKGKVYLEIKQISPVGKLNSTFVPVWKDSVIEIPKEVAEDLDDIILE